MKEGIRTVAKTVTEKPYEEVQSSLLREMNKKASASDLMDLARDAMERHGENASPAVNRVMEKAFHAAKGNPLIQAQIADEMMEHGKFIIARTAYQDLVYQNQDDLDAKLGLADAITKSTEMLMKEPRNKTLNDFFVDDLKKAEKMYDELIQSADKDGAPSLAEKKKYAADVRGRIDSANDEK